MNQEQLYEGYKKHVRKIAWQRARVTSQAIKVRKITGQPHQWSATQVENMMLLSEYKKEVVKAIRLLNEYLSEQFSDPVI